jgi:hypothetical protein
MNTTLGNVLLSAALFAPLPALAAEKAPPPPPPTIAADPHANTLTDAEKRQGWKLLFDGKSLDQWRNFKKDTISPKWTVRDGCIVLAGSGGGDIVTKEQYAAFELTLDYNISIKGNSGLMYHSTETEKTPWYTGPEVQIQDYAGGDPVKAGWLYQLYQPPIDPNTGKPLNTEKPPGEWNTLRILITPERCEHYMNGVKYVEYVKGSKDWDERVAKSKFAKIPTFGKATAGHIVLQDHGNWVAFRNIKVRPIEAK